MSYQKADYSEFISSIVSISVHLIIDRDNKVKKHTAIVFFSLSRLSLQGLYNCLSNFYVIFIHFALKDLQFCFAVFADLLNINIGLG